MPQEAIKKRLERAKTSATRILENAGYDIILSDNKKACLVGLRRTETRVIRVVIDQITDEDVRIIKNLKAPHDACQKEIWCRKGARFEILEI
jgi:hypothetical protein